MVEVENGHATIQIDTTDYDEGRYKIQANYTDGNYYENAYDDTSILTLENPSTVVEYGAGTSNPWTTDMWNNITLDKNEAYSYYIHSGGSILRAVPFTGDFSIDLAINPITNTDWHFGLLNNNTSTTTSVVKIQQNSYNGTSIASIHTGNNWDWDDVYNIKLERTGTTYKLSYNGNTYTQTINETGTLYFYMYHTGNGSIFLRTLTHTY